MASWKKVIVSGSQAELGNIFVTNAVTASYFKGDGSAITNVSAGSLDIDNFSELSGANMAQGDHVLVSDAGTEKKITFSNFEDSIFASVSGDIAIAAGGAATIQANSVALGTDTTGNYVATLANATNGGTTIANGSDEGGAATVTINLNDLSAATVAVASDSIAIIDADDNSTKKEAIADVVTAIAGDGLAASSGVLAVGVDDSSIEISSDSLQVKASGITNAMLGGSIAASKLAGSIGDSKLSTISTANKVALSALDIDGASALGGAPAGADLIPIDDGAGGTNKSMTVSNLQTYMQSNLTFTTNTDTVDMGDGFVLEDGDGTEVTITENKEVKFVEGGAININWSDTDNGTDADPYDLTFNAIVDDSSIEINGSDQLQVKASGITNAMLGGSIAASKLAGSIGDGKLSTISTANKVALSALDIDGASALGGAPAGADLIPIDDGAGGTNKSMTVSNLQTYMQSNLTFTTNTDTVDMGDGFVLEDGDGTEVTITENKEVKFVEGGGIDIDWTDTSDGSDGDPYDLTFTVSGVTNAMLAGSIANAKLANSSISVGGSDISLGGTVTGANIAAALNSDLGGNFTIGNQSSDTATFSGGVTVTGDLTVNGTTTTIDTTNLSVKDKFAIFASGSTSDTDGGIIVQNSATAGYALGYDSNTDRWALDADLAHDGTNLGPDAYVGTVEYSTSAPSSAPVYGGSSAGYGTIHVETDTGDIYIYS